MPTNPLIQYVMRSRRKNDAYFGDCRETLAEAEHDAKDAYADGEQIMGLYEVEVFGTDIKLIQNGDQFMRDCDEAEEVERQAEEDAEWESMSYRQREAAASAYRHEQERG